MRTVGPINSGAAVGEDGSATSNADNTIPISGIVRAVYVKYNDSPPAGTTDVVVSTKGTNPPSVTILSISNGATDGWYFPVVNNHLNSDGSELSKVYGPLAIDDLINVKIDGANADDNVDVYLIME